MAEGFEPYHIPQQSRRDKLRFIHLHQQEQEFISVSDHHNHHQSLQVLGNFHGGSANILAPLYDPSPDLLTCAASHGFHPQSPHLLGPSDSVKQNPVQFVKEEGVNLMGFASGGGSSTISSSSCSSSHHPVFMDSVSNPCNPGAIQDFSHHPFAYAPPNHHYHGGAAASGGDGGGVVLYKPEPLSLSHNSRLSTAAAATGQGLSLSLSSSHQAAPARNCHLLELNQGYSGSRFPGPIGPFTGYASILSGSRFLRPAQQLLDEICGLGTGISAEKMSPDSSLLDPSCEENSNFGEDSFSYNDGSEHGRKKSRLLSMLDEVYKRYRQYYQQLHTVVVSFESVAGLSNAAPFASLAIKGLSKHFRCLKNAITDQLQCSSKSPANLSIRKDQAMRPEGADEGCLYGSRFIRASGILDQPPVWRPQRGLPERAVSVLRAWLFEHFLHPYPTDTDKMMLAKQTGLSRNQVSNWFINARVRLWKPLVEEIHTLETRQAQKASQREPLLNPLPSNDMSGSPSKDEDPPPKRTRDELVELPVSLQHYNNHLCSTYMGIRGSAASSNVSLTLGLHQNNGVGLSETFPANMSHHQYGLSATSDGCVMGGQLLHDFVG